MSNFTKARLERNIDNWGFVNREPYEELVDDYLKSSGAKQFNDLNLQQKKGLFLVMALFAVLKEKQFLEEVELYGKRLFSEKPAYEEQEMYIARSKEWHKAYDVSSLQKSISDEALLMLLRGVTGLDKKDAKKVIIENPEYAIKVLEDSIKGLPVDHFSLNSLNKCIVEGFKSEVALLDSDKMTVFDGEGNPLVKDLSSFENCF